MDGNELLKLLGPYGFAGVLAYVLVRILWQLAERGIAALDRLCAVVAEHTKVDLEHHAEVKEEIVGLRSRIDGMRDVTPVEGTRRPKTNPHGVPLGYYGPRRPKTHGDDE